MMELVESLCKEKGIQMSCCKDKRSCGDRDLELNGSKKEIPTPKFFMEGPWQDEKRTE